MKKIIKLITTLLIFLYVFFLISGCKSSAKNGFVQEKGYTYYYINDEKQTGWVQDGYYSYYMNTDGVMQTGWIKDKGDWYYLDTDGKMCANHWIENKYFVDQNGRMLKNTSKVMGKTTYVFNDMGVASVASEASKASKAPFYSDSLWNVNIYLEDDLSKPINVSKYDIVEWKLHDLKFSINTSKKGLILYINGIAEYYKHIEKSYYKIYTGPQKPNILCRLKMTDDKGVTSSTSGISEGSAISVGEKTYVTWEIGYLPLLGGNIKMDFTGPD